MQMESSDDGVVRVTMLDEVFLQLGAWAALRGYTIAQLPDAEPGDWIIVPSEPMPGQAEMPR